MGTFKTTIFVFSNKGKYLIVAYYVTTFRTVFKPVHYKMIGNAYVTNQVKSNYIPVLVLAPNCYQLGDIQLIPKLDHQCDPLIEDRCFVISLFDPISLD